MSRIEGYGIAVFVLILAIALRFWPDQDAPSPVIEVAQGEPSPSVQYFDGYSIANVEEFTTPAHAPSQRAAEDLVEKPTMVIVKISNSPRFAQPAPQAPKPVLSPQVVRNNELAHAASRLRQQVAELKTRDRELASQHEENQRQARAQERRNREAAEQLAQQQNALLIAAQALACKKQETQHHQNHPPVHCPKPIPQFVNSPEAQRIIKANQRSAKRTLRAFHGKR